MRIYDVVEFLIQKGPGRTAAELARAIFGNTGYQQRVNQECNLLMWIGKVRREGRGGTDPFRYYPG